MRRFSRAIMMALVLLAPTTVQAHNSQSGYLSADYVRLNTNQFHEKDLLLSIGGVSPLTRYLSLQYGASFSAELLFDATFNVWLSQHTAQGNIKTNTPGVQNQLDQSYDNQDRYSGVPFRLETLMQLHPDSGSPYTPQLLAGIASSVLVHGHCRQTYFVGTNPCSSTTYLNVGLALGAGMDISFDAASPELRQVFVQYLHVFDRRQSTTDIVRLGCYF